MQCSVMLQGTCLHQPVAFCIQMQVTLMTSM